MAAMVALAVGTVAVGTVAVDRATVERMGVRLGVAATQGAPERDGSSTEPLLTTTAAAMMADESPAVGLFSALLGAREDASVRGSATWSAAPVPADRYPVEETAGPAPSIADPETARLLAAEGPGTYVDELLDAARPALTRWPARGDAPIRYWVQPGAGLPDYVLGNRRQVSEAFEAWERSGIPLTFSPTPDSTEADIVVVWTASFDEPISGRTRWMHDRRGWIRSARVTIALHRYTGELLDGDALHAIALHEVGHALGMDHSSDIENVMAPKVRVRTLSGADQATARLLYRLPAGLHR